MPGSLTASRLFRLMLAAFALTGMTLYCCVHKHFSPELSDPASFVWMFVHKCADALALAVIWFGYELFASLSSGLRGSFRGISGWVLRTPIEQAG